MNGKKTYLAAAATILSAVAAGLSETMTWPQALALIVPAILACTLRNALPAKVA